MSIERVDRIAFRFTHNELAALLKLMDLPALPDIEVLPSDPERRTAESLVESGIVMFCGERTLVDRTVGLVLKNAALSRERLTARGCSGRAVLLRGEQMCVLAEDGDGVVTMEPLRDLPAAREPWMTASGRLEGALTVRLTDKSGLYEEGTGAEAPRAFFDKMLTL